MAAPPAAQSNSTIAHRAATSTVRALGSGLLAMLMRALLRLSSSRAGGGQIKAINTLARIHREDQLSFASSIELGGVPAPFDRPLPDM